MSKQLAIIEQTLKSDDTVNQLILAGSLPNDDVGKTQANKYIMSIMGEIKRTEGTENALSLCSPDSIRQTLIDSFRYKVPIDGRKMAHVDVRWNKEKKCKEAILQIDTNGFVAKIAEHYPDFHITATPVFQGDEFSILDDGNVRHIQKNPFCTDISKLEGMIVKASYTKGGRLLQEAIPVTKQDLLSMKSASKAQNVWNNWTLERMKTAAIKRICKWHFRTIQGIQEIIDFDNSKNYDVGQAVEVKAKTAIDSINEAIATPPAPEIKDDDIQIIDAEIVDDEPDNEAEASKPTFTMDDLETMLIQAQTPDDIKTAAKTIAGCPWLTPEQKEAINATYKLHKARVAEAQNEDIF